jgi:hypothetical protein
MTRIRDMPLSRTVSAAGEEASPRGVPAGLWSVNSDELNREHRAVRFPARFPQGTHRTELFQTSRVRLRTHA